jgi:hypothetical protein
VEGYVALNRCKLRAMGAGPRDIRAFVLYERAHGHGLDHYQGTPEVNAAYFPEIKICRC